MARGTPGKPAPQPTSMMVLPFSSAQHSTDRLSSRWSFAKRMNWLETVLPELGVTNTRCITARAEEAVVTHREKFDYATSRAVARLNILLELTAPYVRVGGAVLALKGAAAREELAEAKNAIKKLGLKLEEVREYPIDGASHAVILLRKISHTPACYPRRFAQIKKSPL